MSEQLRESLSAALDDEADAFELRRVIDEACQDEALLEEWSRLNLMRDVIRDDLTYFRPDLKQRTWDELTRLDETSQAPVVELAATQSQPEAGAKQQSMLGWLTGVGVATAAAVLVMINGGLFQPQTSGPSLANSDIGVNPGNPELARPVMYQQATAADLQRQNGFIVRHFQHNAINRAGVVNFAKMATYANTPNNSQVNAKPEQEPTPTE